MPGSISLWIPWPANHFLDSQESSAIQTEIAASRALRMREETNCTWVYMRHFLRPCHLCYLAVTRFVCTRLFAIFSLFLAPFIGFRGLAITDFLL